MRTYCVWAAAFGFVLCAGADTSAWGQADAWGDLSGSFKLHRVQRTDEGIDAGDPPSQLSANRADRSIVIGENSGIANVVVYLVPDRGLTVPVHPSVASAADSGGLLTVTDRGFEPRISCVQPGQTLRIVNAGHASYDLRGDLFKANRFSTFLVPSGTDEVKFRSAEKVPLPLSSAIHPAGSSYLLVSATPYAAVTDAEGRFRIPKLPIGSWTFRVWHERFGYVENFEKDGRVRSASKGLLEVIIQEGPNDLGTIAVPSREL